MKTTILLLIILSSNLADAKEDFTYLMTDKKDVQALHKAVLDSLKNAMPKIAHYDPVFDEPSETMIAAAKPVDNEGPLQ